MTFSRVRNRRRRKILTAALMPVLIVGIPVALVLISGARSLEQLEQASERLLTQTASGAAEDLAGGIRDELAAEYRRFLATVPEESLDDPSLAALGEAVAARTHDGLLGTFFVVAAATGSSSPAFVELRRHEAPVVMARPVALAPMQRHGSIDLPASRRLGEAVAARVADIAAHRAVDGCGFLQLDGRRYLMAARRFDELARDITRYVAYALPVEAFVGGAFPTLGADLREARHPLPTGEPVEVAIIDGQGRESYRTGPSLLGAYVHEAPLPMTLMADAHLSVNPDGHRPVPVWSVRAGYPGTDAAALARSSTNQQRQLLYLVTVVAAVGILLAGRSIARELSVAEMKGEFVSSVSHDLKTPVASIRLLADLIGSGARLGPERIRGYGQTIGAEARRLGKLIEGILEFERIDTGGRTYSVDIIDLRKPLRSALGEYATPLRETGFTTCLRLPGRAVPFAGNADALCHAFSNLIGNAIKYSDVNRYLGISMAIVERNVVVRIEDHGSGIPATERTKIFDRFYRVRNDPETDPAGTGLGLPIARHVIRSHGGRISVSGSPAEGSVFTVELPFPGTRREQVS